MQVDWQISALEKKKYMESLSDELVTLRAKAGIPQDELSKLVGISRQTYGAIERGKKEMTWEVYMALLFFFEKNSKTRKLLDDLSIYPYRLIECINNGVMPDNDNFRNIVGNETAEMLKTLDEKAIKSINSVIKAEYARCREKKQNAVIRAFNGWILKKNVVYNMQEVTNNIKFIKSMQVLS